MFFINNYYYFITIALQAFCVIHCIRKGNNNAWIWFVVLVPIVGSIAYIFSEVFKDTDVRKVQSGMSTVFNPTGKIKKLEANLKFSDTFNNRIALADAYLAAGQTERAIELYESSLTGNFTENEYVLMKLIIAYDKIKRYADIIPVAKKIYRQPQFTRSHAHVLYAMALAQIGRTGDAEKEFLGMKTRFSNFEARYQYGVFLIKHERMQEGKQVLHEMIDEASHLTSREKRYNKEWFSLAKDELGKVRSRESGISSTV